VPSPLLAPAVLLAALTGCAHAPRAAIRAPALDGRCDAAAELLARRPPRQTVDDEFRQVFTQPLSYAVAGAGYAVDGTVLVGLGVVGGGLVCLPAAALDAMFDGDGELYGECFVSVAGTIIGEAGLPGAGRGLARATRRWRCPDRTRLAREARTVAACYARRAAPGDLGQARELVAALHRDDRVRACLPRRERRANARALDGIEAALEVSAWTEPLLPASPAPSAAGEPAPPELGR
jgi:hypothetical protein